MEKSEGPVIDNYVREYLQLTHTICISSSGVDDQVWRRKGRGIQEGGRATGGINLKCKIQED